MDTLEFLRHVINICSKYDFIQGIETQLLDEPVVKIKAVINNDTFINIFYNAETEKYSFVLVKNNKRIFGIDNTKNWHIHPFEDPESHIETAPVSLLNFQYPTVSAVGCPYIPPLAKGDEGGFLNK
ncbi:MAG: hypothetical protein HY754_08065 [Nitrospirae bacterium]|nr:hypothetical protein [Nitrospirota bacterium]